MSFHDEVKVAMANKQSSENESVSNADLESDHASKAYERELQNLWATVQETWAEEVGTISRNVLEWVLTGKGLLPTDRSEELVPYPMDFETVEGERLEGIMLDDHFFFASPGKLHEGTPALISKSDTSVPTTDRFFGLSSSMLNDAMLDAKNSLENSKLRKRSVLPEGPFVNTDSPTATEYEFARFVGPAEAKVHSNAASSTVSVRCSPEGPVSVYMQEIGGDWKYVSSLREMVVNALAVRILKQREK